jgi:hypothetical protein
MLDAASERIEERFINDAEAVRVGTIIAHDKKALAKWRRAIRKTPSQGLTGADLENVVFGLMRTNPDLVRVKQAA